jgi:hypothetical protein
MILEFHCGPAREWIYSDEPIIRQDQKTGAKIETSWSESEAGFVVTLEVDPDQDMARAGVLLIADGRADGALRK